MANDLGPIDNIRSLVHYVGEIDSTGARHMQF